MFSPFPDGTVSYDTRQGDNRGTENSFFDFTYDGTVDHDKLYGGLGQLTDGELGDANFRLESEGTPSKGFEWVGWRNDTPFGEGPIEIVFKFENVRNFSHVLIHCNNYFTKNVRVFKKAELYFSVGGVYFPEEPVKYEFQRDTVMDYNHEVDIDLKHNIGRFVKLKLFFDAKWMLISEVQFFSGKSFTSTEEQMRCVFEPRSEKTGLRGFRPGPTKTGLYSHRRWLEA